MRNSNDRPLGNKELESDEYLVHFKAVVKSITNDASKVLGEIELACQGGEIEEKISLLDHYLDYVGRLCETKGKSELLPFPGTEAHSK